MDKSGNTSSKHLVVGMVLVGIVVGILATKSYDAYQAVSRKWKALNWLMSGYNEEIVYQHMNTQKAELQLVISKK